MDSIDSPPDLLSPIVDQLKAANRCADLWEQLGLAYNRAYCGLIANGFTREEAVLIISRQGPGVGR